MPEPLRIRIWDLPTRLFHWLLVLCVIGLFVTANVGGFWMDYHLLFGYSMLALLLFRFIWGFVGPRYARFSNFVAGPGKLLSYFKTHTPNSAGHSPLAAFSVLAMLLLLSVQVATGLFANDGIMLEGPLTHYVSNVTSDTLTGIHKVNKILIIVLVIVHLLAISWYTLFRKQALVRAMVTGDKPVTQVPDQTPPAEDGGAVWLRAAVAAAISIGVAYNIAAQGTGF